MSYLSHLECALCGATAPQPPLYVWRVGRAMDALHGGDHAQLLKPRYVVRVEVLGVLDAPSPVSFSWRALEGFGKHVQCLAIGAVSDRVHTQLPIVLQAQFRRAA